MEEKSGQMLLGEAGQTCRVLFDFIRSVLSSTHRVLVHWYVFFGRMRVMGLSVLR